jgi:hypothetical protein
MTDESRKSILLVHPFPNGLGLTRTRVPNCPGVLIMYPLVLLPCMGTIRKENVMGPPPLPPARSRATGSHKTVEPLTPLAFDLYTDFHYS